MDEAPSTAAEAAAYKKKIESMQKYVTVLNVTIEKLSRSPQNATKVEQLRTLLKILVGETKGISIKELNEVENALERIYEVFQQSVNKSSPDTSIVAETNSVRTTNDNGVIEEEKISVHDLKQCDELQDGQNNKKDNTEEPATNVELKGGKRIEEEGKDGDITNQDSNQANTQKQNNEVIVESKEEEDTGRVEPNETEASTENLHKIHSGSVSGSNTEIMTEKLHATDSKKQAINENGSDNEIEHNNLSDKSESFDAHEEIRRDENNTSPPAADNNEALIEGGNLEDEEEEEDVEDEATEGEVEYISIPENDDVQESILPDEIEEALQHNTPWENEGVEGEEETENMPTSDDENDREVEQDQLQEDIEDDTSETKNDKIEAQVDDTSKVEEQQIQESFKERPEEQKDQFDKDEILSKTADGNDRTKLKPQEAELSESENPRSVEQTKKEDKIESSAASPKEQEEELLNKRDSNQMEGKDAEPSQAEDSEIVENAQQKGKPEEHKEKLTTADKNTELQIDEKLPSQEENPKTLEQIKQMDRDENLGTQSSKSQEENLDINVENDVTTTTTTVTEGKDAMQLSIENINIACEVAEATMEQVMSQNDEDGCSSDAAADVLAADPLEAENVEKTPSTTDASERKTPVNEDDDDDVQIIETDDAPICIDSDDDDDGENVKDPQNITTKTQGAVARKSTAKPPVKRAKPPAAKDLVKRKRNFDYLSYTTKQKRHRVLDTIELSDSCSESDNEDDSKTQKQNSKPNSGRHKRQSLWPRSDHYRPTEQAQRISKPTKTKVASTIPPPPPTPQSNFLIGFDLQPASCSGPNPRVFSAQCGNKKNVIIPNAFYGTRRDSDNGKDDILTPLATAPTTAKLSPAELAARDRIYRDWLENFLVHFTSPQETATNESFALLKAAVKDDSLGRIIETRTFMNQNADMAISRIEFQTLVVLRSCFYKNGAVLSDTGRYFCELACNAKKVSALTIHARTLMVTSKTISSEDFKRKLAVFKPKTTTTTKPIVAITTAPVTSTTVTATATTPSSASSSKRSNNDDDDEYAPEVNLSNTVGGAGVRRSKRLNRSKRKDKNFSYNENEESEEDTDDLPSDSEVAVQRKIEKKRLEAKRKQEEMAKSFEKSYEQLTEQHKPQLSGNASKRSRKSTIVSHSNSSNHSASPIMATADNCSMSASLTEPLLIISDDDDNSVVLTHDTTSAEFVVEEYDEYEPIPHRIFKNIPSNNSTSCPSSTKSKRKQSQRQADSDSEPEFIATELYMRPKNTRLDLDAINVNGSECLICGIQDTDIVNHYVNDHPESEVFTSRLREDVAAALITKTKNSQIPTLTSSTCVIKANRKYFSAICVFCQEQFCYLPSYWYRHFSLHTGEYAYRCCHCWQRRPTYNAAKQHACNAKRGVKSLRVLDEFNYNLRGEGDIEGYICQLCNYVQLHRKHVIKHLTSEHSITGRTAGSMVKTIKLLSVVDAPNMVSSSLGFPHNQLASPVLDDSSNLEFLSLNQDIGDPTDDLSFMICGMLDVPDTGTQEFGNLKK